MMIFEDLSSITSPSKPCVFTIGSFDGVHLGHQQLLRRMREVAGPGGTVCVLTFSNHPSQVLPGRAIVPLILTKSLKLKYLEEYGVDLTYCLEFTTALSEIGYEAFLDRIKKAYPFDYLILGEGASLGKKREGTPEKIKALCTKLGFKIEYLPKLISGEKAISSGMIRTYIQEGQIPEAASLLGHPYIIEGVLEEGELILPANLCLPPTGDYAVMVHADSFQTEIIAHIENGKVAVNLPMGTEKILLFFQ